MWGSRDSNYRLNFQKDLLENSRQNQEHIKQGNKYFPKSTVHLEKQTVYIMQRNYLKIPNGRGFMYYQIKTVILNINKKSLTTQKLRNIIGEVKFQVESDNGSIDFCLISLNFYIKRKKLSIYLSAHYLSISSKLQKKKKKKEEENNSTQLNEKFSSSWLLKHEQVLISQGTRHIWYQSPRGSKQRTNRIIQRHSLEPGRPIWIQEVKTEVVLSTPRAYECKGSSRSSKRG